MRKLNTTGSYYISNGHYWSYSTKLDDTFKGYRFINLTRYSTTTSKHQSDLKTSINYDYALYHCPYGDWDIKEAIKREINALQDALAHRLAQRKTEKQKEDITNLQADIDFLISLINNADELPEEGAKK